MTPVTIERLTIERAQARHAEILDELGMDTDHLRELAHAYRLDARQRALASELDRLEYLLDEVA